jgi:hypothetical protein
MRTSATSVRVPTYFSYPFVGAYPNRMTVSCASISRPNSPSSAVSPNPTTAHAPRLPEGKFGVAHRLHESTDFDDDDDDHDTTSSSSTFFFFFFFLLFLLVLLSSSSESSSSSQHGRRSRSFSHLSSRRRYSSSVDEEDVVFSRGGGGGGAPKAHPPYLLLLLLLLLFVVSFDGVRDVLNVDPSSFSPLVVLKDIIIIV